LRLQAKAIILVIFKDKIAENSLFLCKASARK
jgi:hypothetical protein